MQCGSEKAHKIVDDIKKKPAKRSDDMLTLSAAFGVSATEKGEEFVFKKAYEAADQKMYQGMLRI